MGLNLQTKQSLVKVLSAIVLIAIIINQTLWLLSMHKVYEKEFEDWVAQSSQEAIWIEFSERLEHFGGASFYAGNNPKDTTRFFEKKVVTEDSTYYFTIDKQDIHSNNKIVQFVIKKKQPVNLDNLNNIFASNLSRKYLVKDSYFEYIDLDSGKILNSNKTQDSSGLIFYQTDTIPLDIISSIGVIGYVSVPTNAMLLKMSWQLFISVLLILIAIIGLLYISKSFVWQWKTEMMRQDSIYAMTHEFKRPISAAVVLAQLIPIYIKRDENNIAIEYADNINDELTRLTQYINTIKQISNSESSNIKLDKKEVDISLLCNSIIKRFEEKSTDNQRISIKLEVLTKRIMMNIDVVHFSNVIENLIENAIKYNINDIVVIEIILNDYEDKHKVSVIDNGIGISSKSQKLIFHRYYRDKRYEVKNRLGFGLGLTYSKSIIDAHGGKITVQSDLDKGSKFDIII